MKLAFKKNEIDYHILRFIVGSIAIGLPLIAVIFSEGPIDSISASYYEGDFARNIFVGLLFAISSFLFSYNGHSILEMVFAKVAALAAIGVAIFPCSCGENEAAMSSVHYISATAMFLVLTYYCWAFYKRARTKTSTQSIVRSYIYAGCGIAIVSAISFLAIDFVTGGFLSGVIQRLVFYGEAVGLMAFGTSWLVASRAIPIVTAKNERILIMPFTKI